MDDLNRENLIAEVEAIKRDISEIKDTLMRSERVVGSGIEGINSRLDHLNQKVVQVESSLGQFAAESRRSSLFLAFLGLCATVMLSGISLVATGGDYVSGGRILSIAGIALILLIPVTWKSGDICYRIGYALAILCVVIWLSVTYYVPDASFGRVASWVLGVPGVILMLVGLFHLRRR